MVSDLPPGLADHSVRVVREKEGRLPTLAEREEEYIRHVLDHCGQNRTRAAKILGIDRVSLWRKLKKYGLSEEEEG
jgi:DNA-binding NtrC family response regulator